MKAILLTALCLCLLVMPAYAQDDEPSPEPPLASSAAEDAEDDTTALDDFTATPVFTPTLTPRPTITPTHTPTPTPRPDVAAFVTDWAEDVIYPQGFFFRLSLNVPLADVEAITLTLEIDGEASPRTITDSTLRQAAINTERFTDIAFIWRIPPNNPPPFQAIIFYRWQVTLADGRTAEVPGLTAFRDPAREWVIDDDPAGRFDLIYPAGQTVVLRDNLTPLYELLAERTGTTPTFAFAFNPANAPLNPCATQTTVISARFGESLACEGDIVRTALTRGGYIVVDGLSTPDVISRIAGATVDAFFVPVWSDMSIPDWFADGVRGFLLSGERLNELQRMREAERVGSLYALNAMDATVDDALWRAQAYMMTLYIADTYGLDVLYDLAASPFDPDEPFTERYQRIVGASLERLMPSVVSWIHRERAADASLLRLFDEPTPSPTPSNTPSPFPPTSTATATETATPTDTPTITPTPTITGTLSATPLPSSTPTITPTPAPPTLTPLPAGFQFPTLPPPTPDPDVPVPTPTATAGGTSNQNVPIIVGLVGLIVLMAVIGLTLVLTGKKD